MQILTNHIGYDPGTPKRAIIKCNSKSPTPGFFTVVTEETNEIVQQGKVVHSGAVDQWKDWTFWTVDFSALNKPGKYRLAVQDKNGVTQATTYPFEIRTHLIRETISDIMYYFRGQRCADEWNDRDYSVPVFNENRSVDAHGGWYDASGDVSKYLSHLSYANYMNPQQTPLCVWGMFKAAAELAKKNETEEDFGTDKLVTTLLKEAMFGSDFLVRMQDPCGAFYMTLFDQWTADPEKRMICEYKTQAGDRYDTWQCAWRQGGGMSIAALAVAARSGRKRDYTADVYLARAITGFDHLQEHNLKYCNDGKENIIDDYCALLAATELYATTKEDRFLDAAIVRADNLINRISSDSTCSGWMRADDDGNRTFYHGAEAGLPIIALLNLVDNTTDAALKERIVKAVEKLVAFELSVTSEVNNPFGYPRQYVSPVDAPKRTSFFIAQKNESGYWWQGENARLGSLACAARYAARHLKGEMATRLNDYAANCIDWMLGMNPYGVCMLQGRGHNNATYEIGFPNAPGGMCNGITAGFTNENDIDFNPEFPHEATTGMHRWRWGEQWIPHSAWYILAVGFENN